MTKGARIKELLCKGHTVGYIVDAVGCSRGMIAFLKARQ